MWRFRRLALVAFSSAGLGASSLSFHSVELPWAAIDTEYHVSIETQGDGRCALGDVSLAIVDGVLPEGLRLQGNGISGAPKQMGNFRFRIRATNNCASADREYQLQVTGTPILRVSPGELAFDYRSGDPSPAPQHILVSSTWPDLAYSVHSAPKWLAVHLRVGLTPHRGSAFASDRATVELLPQELKPGLYEATLVFFAPQGSVPVEVPVRLSVSAPADAATQTAK